MPDYDTDSYCTPKAIVDLARSLMGGIELDPASNDYAQTTVQADRYFTVEDDGLSRGWGDAQSVYLNPPYSQPLCRKFCFKVAEHVENADLPTQAFVLLNASVATKHFHRLITSPVCRGVGFFEGRIPFHHPNPAAPQNRNRYDQAFVWLSSLGKSPYLARIKERSDIERNGCGEVIIAREGMPDLTRPFRVLSPTFSR